MVTSHDEKKRILMMCHNDPTSGHFGTVKTWKRISEHFYWKGMSRDVDDLVCTITYVLAIC